MTPGGTPAAQKLAEACATHLWSTDKASQALGMVLKQIAPGRATLEMTLISSMTNGHGNAHGGLLFSLADSAFAFACNTYNEISVAQHCSITYIHAGTLGDRLTAVARELSRKGRSGIYDVTITRGDGTVLAEFRGHSRSLGRPLLPARNAEG